MKLRFLLVLSTVIVLALVVVHVNRPSSQSANHPPLTATPASHTGPENSPALSKPVSPSQQSQRNDMSDAQGNWASHPLPPGNNLQEQLDELARRRGVPLSILTQQALAQWSNAMNQAAQEINRPIDFYGKAVDEKGEPLSGANVRFGCLVFPENHFMTNAVTDAQGLFSLTGVTGAVLNVRVSKEGYEVVPGTNQNSFAYSSPTGAGFYPDPNNPVTFYLRKKQ
ncbi:MAG TPA: carboxypeptidase-like regulatory domain-containing protein [Verrucomicrobiae bacterium]|nr:carboxypeptidase-like regulatory domain-containing protein [Verrucomicrobiae bacterium]